jgi:hypothetical protein
VTHAEIIAAVRTWPAWLREQWEERAAIKQYCGHFEKDVNKPGVRERSEREAYEEYRHLARETQR